MTQPLNPNDGPGIPDVSGTSPATGAQPRRRKLSTILTLSALALAAGAGWLALHKSDAGTSPLEPAAATASIPVPGEREAAPILPALVSASATPAAPSNTLANAAVATANSATSVVTAVADTFASLRGTLDQVSGRVTTLEGNDRVQDEKIAVLRTDVDGLKSAQVAVQTPSPAASAAVTVAAAAPTPQAATEVTQAPTQPVVRRKPTATRRVAKAAPTPKVTVARADPNGSVLAVDLWDGKPSVALARSSADGTELRFFNEGESQGRVTLKRADIASQKATFSTPTGEFTLEPKER